MPYKDPEKRRRAQRKSQRKYYARNKDYYKRRREAQRTAAIEFVRALKERGKCALCPEDVVACLDFHHCKGKKRAAISDAARSGWGLPRLEDEIKKCVLLCANCHRKVEAGILSLAGGD